MEKAHVSQVPVEAGLSQKVWPGSGRDGQIQPNYPPDYVTPPRPREYTEGMTRISQKGVSIPEWMPTHISRLTHLGWNFIKPDPAFPDASNIASYDENTPTLVQEWKNSGTPVELSIVVVSSHRDLMRTPSGALAYLASSYRFAKQARADGIHINTIRILDPVEINIHVTCRNTREAALQRANAEAFYNLAVTYKQVYHPELDEVKVTLDTGKHITKETLEELSARMQRLKTTNPGLVEELTQELGPRALKHRKNGHDTSNIDVEIISYILAHPEAWGHSDEEILFEKNGFQRINFVPASELDYCVKMRRAQSIWQRSQNNIATVVSNKFQTAPYHSKNGEPSLGALMENNDLRAGVAQKLQIENADPVTRDQILYSLAVLAEDTSGSNISLSDLLRETRSNLVRAKSNETIIYSAS